jgi:hypothetical protein
MRRIEQLRFELSYVYPSTYAYYPAPSSPMTIGRLTHHGHKRASTVRCTRIRMGVSDLVAVSSGSKGLGPRAFVKHSVQSERALAPVIMQQGRLG